MIVTIFSRGGHTEPQGPLSCGCHTLYQLCIASTKEVSVKLEENQLIVDSLSWRIDVGDSVCWLIVHHWGREITFRCNNHEPNLEVLQCVIDGTISWRGNWVILDCKKPLAASGASGDCIPLIVEHWCSLCSLLDKTEQAIKAGKKCI